MKSAKSAQEYTIKDSVLSIHLTAHSPRSRSGANCEQRAVRDSEKVKRERRAMEAKRKNR